MTEPNVKDEDREPSHQECIAASMDSLSWDSDIMRRYPLTTDEKRLAIRLGRVILTLRAERDEQVARAETLRAALVACENYLADGDYGEEPDLRDVRDKALAALSATPAASLAALRLRDAERVRQSAIVIAHGACRAGEKCQDDGGCRHVPCITARMIVADLQRIDLSALLGIAVTAEVKPTLPPADPRLINYGEGVLPTKEDDRG